MDGREASGFFFEAGPDNRGPRRLTIGDRTIEILNSSQEAAWTAATKAVTATELRCERCVVTDAIALYNPEPLAIPSDLAWWEQHVMKPDWNWLWHGHLSQKQAESLAAYIMANSAPESGPAATLQYSTGNERMLRSRTHTHTWGKTDFWRVGGCSEHYLPGYDDYHTWGVVIINAKKQWACTQDTKSLKRHRWRANPCPIRPLAVAGTIAEITGSNAMPL